MLDDALAENTASAVLDDTPSSSWAVEGHLASPSRRAPSHAMLDDIVSPKPSRGDARWHAARKHRLSMVLVTTVNCGATDLNVFEFIPIKPSVAKA